MTVFLLFYEKWFLWKAQSVEMLDNLWGELLTYCSGWKVNFNKSGFWPLNSKVPTCLNGNQLFFFHYILLIPNVFNLLFENNFCIVVFCVTHRKKYFWTLVDTTLQFLIYYITLALYLMKANVCLFCLNLIF